MSFTNSIVSLSACLALSVFSSHCVGMELIPNCEPRQAPTRPSLEQLHPPATMTSLTVDM